ncbi:MAG: hypothetical protein LBR81_02610 [Prevotellaceae bacterium]|jgi:hypothetical protein|nr:hypothetical protein [Prevotellaceae bacterium]
MIKKTLAFYDKRPKEGGKKIPFHKFIESMGLPINPTHNFGKIKEYRFKIYEVQKQKFIENRKFEEVSTDNDDIKFFFLWWLHQELKVVERWLADTYPNGERKKIKTDISNAIEIIKYQEFIKGEISRQNEKKSDKTVSKNALDKIVIPLKKDSLYKYLDELKEVFSNYEGISDINFNAICLVVKEKNFFKKQSKFSGIVKAIASYYDIEPPKESKESKCSDRKNELMRQHLILDKEIQ